MKKLSYRIAWARSALFPCSAGVLLACAAAVPAHAATNVLTNPGFEAGTASGWTTYGSHAVESTNNLYYNGGSTVGASNVLTHSGGYVGKTWGSFTGGFNVNGFYQDSVAGAGSVWSAAGFAFTHEQDLMQSGNQFWFEMTFRDASDSVLGMYRSQILDPAGTDGVVSNNWYNLAVTNEYDISDTSYQTITNTGASFTAPAGTAKVRFQAVYAQLSGYPGGSMYFDDLSLTKVAGSDPDISAASGDMSKVEGQTAVFAVTAAGGSTLHYQWQKDGADLANDSRVSGATTATLTVKNLTQADQGKYTVIVSDNAGQVTSTPATLSVVTTAQASNVLGNPGFESGLDFPWQRFNGGGLVTAIGDPTGMLPSSAYASETWGTGAGTWNGLFQDIATTPGQAFTADGQFLVSEGAPITGASEAWLEVQFMDGNGNMIGLYRSDHITSNSVPSVWMNLQATNTIAFWGDYSVVGQVKYLVAPANTAKVRYQITYHGGDGGGAVYYDNMNLFLRAPVTVTPSVSGNTILLTFPTQIGVSYQVLYKNDWSDASWQVLKTITGDLSGNASVTDTTGITKRFYRVNTL